MPSKKSDVLPRIVLDTNNLVSSQINKKGTSAQIYSLWRENKVILCTSPFQLKEFEKVLNYKRVKDKYQLTGKKIKSIIFIIKKYSKVVYPQKIPNITAQDPDDNQVLAIAAEAQADLIISGDQHLLVLKRFQNIPVITAKEFILQLFQHKK